jgi:hypothetical protein
MVADARRKHDKSSSLVQHLTSLLSARGEVIADNYADVLVPPHSKEGILEFLNHPLMSPC